MAERYPVVDSALCPLISRSSYKVCGVRERESAQAVGQRGAPDASATKFDGEAECHA